MAFGEVPSRAPWAVFGVFIFLIAGWRSCVEFRESRGDAARKARVGLLEKATNRYRIEVDSFCRRGPEDSLEHRDGLAWISGRTGLPLRAHGREDVWDWGCLQTPDSGIVVFVAVDTGCANQSGDFWSFSCRLASQTWDLKTSQGVPASFSTSTKSLWKFPGDSKVCPVPRRSAPPQDSALQELCGTGLPRE